MSLENFQFDSFAAFMAMNGHGPYVWSAYGISALVLIYLTISPLRRRRVFLNALSKQQALAQRQNIARQNKARQNKARQNIARQNKSRKNTDKNDKEVTL